MYYTMPFSGKPGPTTRIAVGDVVDNLADEFTSSTDGKPAIGALVTCEANDIRFTMGGDIDTPTYPPTQGANGLGHILYENQSLALASPSQVRTFQFINHTAQSDAIIQVTPFFEGGVT